MYERISPAVAFCCISVNADGFNYTVIYGRYENGHYCSIPNHGIGCDMSNSTDTFYNAEALLRHNVSPVAAKAIAEAIKEAVKKIRGEA